MNWQAAFQALGAGLALVGFFGSIFTAVMVSFAVEVDGRSRKLWLIPVGVLVLALAGLMLTVGLS